MRRVPYRTQSTAASEQMMPRTDVLARWRLIFRPAPAPQRVRTRSCGVWPVTMRWAPTSASVASTCSGVARVRKKSAKESA